MIFGLYTCCQQINSSVRKIYISLKCIFLYIRWLFHYRYHVIQVLAIWKKVGMLCMGCNEHSMVHFFLTKHLHLKRYKSLSVFSAIHQQFYISILTDVCYSLFLGKSRGYCCWHSRNDHFCLLARPSTSFPLLLVTFFLKKHNFLKFELDDKNQFG